MKQAVATTLKAHVLANHASEWAAGQVGTIADIYNAVAAPDFYVWRTAIPAAEIKGAVTWSELISASQGQRDVFRILVNEGSINAADPNIRAAFGAMFSAGATLTALGDLAKRKATLLEKLCATGTGSIGSPATLTHEGSISPQEVYEAMNNG